MHVKFQSSLKLIFATLIQCVLSTLFHIFFPFPYDVVNMGVDSLPAGNIRLPIFLFKTVSIVSVNLHISVLLTFLFIFVVWSIRSYHAKIVPSPLGIPISRATLKSQRNRLSRECTLNFQSERNNCHCPKCPSHRSYCYELLLWTSNLIL